MSRGQWLALALIVPVVLIGAFVAARTLGGDDGPSVGMRIADADVEDADWFYRIPAGTADRIAAGEPVEIVPAELTVELGDTIRIVNDDSSAHIVGVFFVGAGETVTQQFQSVGVLEGECSVHPSGSFSLRVVDA
jgi:plastocyanin